MPTFMAWQPQKALPLSHANSTFSNEPVIDTNDSIAPVAAVEEIVDPVLLKQ